MPTALDERKVIKPIPQGPAGHMDRRKFWTILAIAACLAVIAGGYFYYEDWPFTPKNVVKELELATSSHVQFASFRRFFLPHPGCVLDSVILSRGSTPANQEVMKIRQVVIKGKWTGLIQNHVAIVRADGVDAVFPPFGEGEPWKPAETDVIVDKLIANGAVLQFRRHDSKPPVKFSIEKLIAHHLVNHEPTKFEVRVRNPEPPGMVDASGSFGPWNETQLSATPISGNYSFQNADLGTFGGVRGILSSDGMFNGTLESIVVKGKTMIPDFGVSDTPHKLHLNSQFDAAVDSTNGDVTLHGVQAQLQKTIILTKGTVASHRIEDGKTANLHFAVRNGRIQDLLLMFVSEKKAPLNGAVSLRAHTVVPPGNRPFLQKLRMSGDFGIESAEFTKEETQNNLDKLSTAARGGGDQTDDPESVLSDLTGHVEVRDGVATFSQLRFRIPGARARFDGTFDLITQKVDLRGMLYMDATLPKATSGIKSFLLKAIDPFLKKNRRGGAKFPVSITGTYHNPSYKADPV